MAAAVSSSLAAPQGLQQNEDGLRKDILGYTWPGIEYGEPPSCAYTFFEYIDALRLGDLARFRRLEAACQGWYTPSLDRGAGAALHFAVDHGRLEAVKYLVEQRGVEVNQRDAGRGWTPLMRCARVAHYRHAPYLQIFEYLLQQGADPSIRGQPLAPATPPFQAADSSQRERQQQQLVSVLDVAAEKGFGWEAGAVRGELQRLIGEHAAVLKKAAVTYNGPPVDAHAHRLLTEWQALPKLYPPANWRPPPPAGYTGAQGARHAGLAGCQWRPAGKADGSAILRPMTDAELQAQAQHC